MIYSPEGFVYYFLKSKDDIGEVVFEKELSVDPVNFKGIMFDEKTGEQIDELVFTTPGKYLPSIKLKKMWDRQEQLLTRYL